MKFNFKKVLALFLTFFLGPGIGHLLYRQWRKAVSFIIATLFLGVSFFAQIARTIPESKNITPEVITEQIKIYIFHNPGAFTLYCIILAALWAYALTEIILMDQ